MRYLFVLLAACGSGGGNGGDDDGIDAPPQTSQAGYLQIQSYDAMNTPNTPTRGGTAGAGFWANGSSYCTTTQRIGACAVMTCMTSPPASISGGTVTITGAAQTITLMPNAMNQYETFMVANPLFNGGEMITFTTTGGTVPALTKTITAPAKATITQPAKPPMASPYLVVNRGSDFTVGWTGGGSGKVQVALNSEQADHRAFCQFDASAGTGKVPTTVLTTFAAGNGGFAMASVTEEQAIAGDWSIDVLAYFNAVWPDNAIVSGPTMFQ